MEGLRFQSNLSSDAPPVRAFESRSSTYGLLHSPGETESGSETAFNQNITLSVFYENTREVVFRNEATFSHSARYATDQEKRDDAEDGKEKRVISPSLYSLNVEVTLYSNAPNGIPDHRDIPRTFLVALSRFVYTGKHAYNFLDRDISPLFQCLVEYFTKHSILIKAKVTGCITLQRECNSDNAENTNNSDDKDNPHVSEDKITRSTVHSVSSYIDVHPQVLLLCLCKTFSTGLHDLFPISSDGIWWRSLFFAIRALEKAAGNDNADEAATEKDTKHLTRIFMSLTFWFSRFSLSEITARNARDDQSNDGSLEPFADIFCSIRDNLEVIERNAAFPVLFSPSECACRLEPIDDGKGTEEKDQSSLICRMTLQAQSLSLAQLMKIRTSKLIDSLNQYKVPLDGPRFRAIRASNKAIDLSLSFISEVYVLSRDATETKKEYEYYWIKNRPLFFDHSHIKGCSDQVEYSCTNNILSAVLSKNIFTPFIPANNLTPNIFLAIDKELRIEEPEVELQRYYKIRSKGAADPVFERILMPDFFFSDREALHLSLEKKLGYMARQIVSEEQSDAEKCLAFDEGMLFTLGKHVKSILKGLDMYHETDKAVSRLLVSLKAFIATFHSYSVEGAKRIDSHALRESAEPVLEDAAKIQQLWKAIDAASFPAYATMLFSLILPRVFKGIERAIGYSASNTACFIEPYMKIIRDALEGCLYDEASIVERQEVFPVFARYVARHKFICTAIIDRMSILESYRRNVSSEVPKLEMQQRSGEYLASSPEDYKGRAASNSCFRDTIESIKGNLYTLHDILGNKKEEHQLHDLIIDNLQEKLLNFTNSPSCFSLFECAEAKEIMGQVSQICENLVRDARENIEARTYNLDTLFIDNEELDRVEESLKVDCSSLRGAYKMILEWECYITGRSPSEYSCANRSPSDGFSQNRLPLRIDFSMEFSLVKRGKVHQQGLPV